MANKRDDERDQFWFDEYIQELIPEKDKLIKICKKAQLDVLRSIVAPSSLEAAPLREKVNLFRELTKAIRLMSGESTDNLAIKSTLIADKVLQVSDNTQLSRFMLDHEKNNSRDLAKKYDG